MLLRLLLLLALCLLAVGPASAQGQPDEPGADAALEIDLLVESQEGEAATNEMAPTVAPTPAPTFSPVPTLAGPSSGPERLLEPRPLGSVEIRGVAFTHIQHEGHDIYHRPGVTPEQVHRAGAAISRAHAHAPNVIGIPAPRVDYYLFPAQADLQRGISQLARVPAAYLANYADGIATHDMGHSVTFAHAATFENEMRGTWLVAHELTHHLQARLAHDVDYPAWFNEGIAEYVGSTVARQLHQDDYTHETFITNGLLVNAARHGALPKLGPLATDAQWVAANNRDQSRLLYPASGLAVEWLVSRHGPQALARTLEQVGRGRDFSGAFAEVFGVVLAEFDTGFHEHIGASMGSAYPPGINLSRSSAPTNGQLRVMLSLQPRERARLELAGGQCQGTRSVTANAAGFVVLSLGGVQARCAGRYTVTMTGSMGTNGTAEITLTSPAAR